MKFLIFKFICSFLISICQNPPAEVDFTKINNEASVEYKTVMWEEMEYRFAAFEADFEKTEVVLNLPNKRKTREIMRNGECDLLINGGFYGKDDKPIGLIVNKGEVSSKKVVSDLFNGFVSMNDSGDVVIGKDVVSEPELAVQSGPILVFDGRPQKLRIKNDAAKRRMVAARSTEGKILFIAIFEPGSKLTGPRLENLPEIVEKIGDTSDFEVESAVNLDGGSASAFYDGSLYIEEANPVGSYFCQKN